MRWYRANGRHALPWRETRDPYAVLISEVMLQQTQVERVLPYYKAWLARWPTFEALAAATAAEVIRQWSGLGYNRRALNLHRLAQAVVAGHGGALPRDEERLRALPGIGPYTASAVRSFAFEERTTVVDTNIARVLARSIACQPNAAVAGPPLLAKIAEGLLPGRNVRDHNLALMDLGAMHCRARNPICGGCPVAGICSWQLAGCPEDEATTSAARRPFAETARFARGRIIDALRSAPSLRTDALTALLPVIHRDRVRIYLEALERDGLIERDEHGAWRLPGQ